MMFRLLAAAFLSVAVHAQTYSKDIAPILYKHCAGCHRPGEAAPFSLLTYDDARSHAKQIVAVTKSRYMPPWKPADGCGEFEGANRLSNQQIERLAAWVQAGTPAGDNPPEAPKFVEGWQLGTPDLVLTLDRPYTLHAAGSDVFRNFILPVPLDRARFVRAVEIRPGAKKVVHHANLLIDRERSLRIRDGEDGAPGFPGMDTRIETRSFDPESHFLFWKPGTAAIEEPAGMSWQIGPGTDLILNAHLQPSGKPEMIQPSIGLYFTDQAPTVKPILVQLEHDGAIDIKPGVNNFVLTDELTLPVEAEVLGVYPHAHYVAKDLFAEAKLPDGSRRCLVHIPDWDINWQATYRYAKPVKLPKGSVISMRYTYDNSAANSRNPSRPPIRVVTGDRSIDEMAHLWLQVVPAGPDGRLQLQKAVMKRRLQKYPGDFFAEFSLASMLQSEGRLEDAILRYHAALKARPKDATAHNALGSALLTKGDITRAYSEFETALRTSPQYADAHYNLARVLLAQDKIAPAIAHLREVIRLQPADAQALSDLGAALHMTGDVEGGLRNLERAVQLEPANFNARFNLGQTLEAMGRIDEARRQYAQAIRLKPDDPDTRAALQRLQRR